MVELSQAAHELLRAYELILQLLVFVLVKVVLVESIPLSVLEDFDMAQATLDGENGIDAEAVA